MLISFSDSNMPRICASAYHKRVLENTFYNVEYRKNLLDESSVLTHGIWML